MANLNLSVVVLDYDGTIADNGVLHPEVRAAIAEIRASGLTVVLATGRILSDLQRVLGDLRVVDAVVAENGAVLAFPESGRSTALGAAPDSFVAALRQHNRAGDGRRMRGRDGRVGGAHRARSSAPDGAAAGAAV
jgi:HAD superfamily hydrolase (TIGR01484 family)